MSVNLQKNVAYGLSTALLNVPLLPTVANRAPTSSDKAAIGTIWVYSAQNIAYVLTSIVNNVADWVIINQGAAQFVTYNVATADATPTAIATYALAPSSAISLSVQANGTKSDFTQMRAGSLFGAFRRQAAGGTLLVSGGYDAPGDISDAVTANIELAVVGNSAVVLVTGQAAEAWNWTAVVSSISRP